MTLSGMMFIPLLSGVLLQTTDPWGWNPATAEAVGSIATVATLLFVIWATFTSKKAADAAKESADIAAREFDLNTRPWLVQIHK
jgi:hypothetical protein